MFLSEEMKNQNEIDVDLQKNDKRIERFRSQELKCSDTM